MQKWILIVLFIVILPACSTAPKHSSQPETAAQKIAKEAAWQQRQTSMSNMKSWQLQGKVGLQHNQESWSFGLSWQQQGDTRYTMNIKNPLTGAIMALIEKDANQVSLKNSAGKIFTDVNAEALLKRELKVGLPLEGMKYWVRGLPSTKHGKFTVSLDNLGRPIKLQQAGWEISYPAYKNNTRDALPDKIILKRSTQTKVKVLAKQWQTHY